MRSFLFATLLIASMIIPAHHLSTQNTALYAQIKETKKTETIKPQEDTKIFKVMIIIMVIWLGIGGYIFTIDKKVKKLENKIDGL